MLLKKEEKTHLYLRLSYSLTFNLEAVMVILSITDHHSCNQKIYGLSPTEVQLLSFVFLQVLVQVLAGGARQAGVRV